MTLAIDGCRVRRTSSQQHRRPEVPKTEAEQDEAIRIVVETELE